MELRINTEETNLDDLKQALEIIKKALERRHADKTQKELPISPQEPEPTLSLETERVEQPVEPPKIETPEPTTPPPSVDISALAMSDYGQEKENRTIDTLTQEKEPIAAPQSSEKDAVLEIITNLKRKNPDGPLYMQNIISLANAKGIPEEKTRQLVSQLKEDGSI